MLFFSIVICVAIVIILKAPHKDDAAGVLIAKQ